MILKNSNAVIFIPDQKSIHEAMERTTHMCIAAHHDDIEIMAYDGILKCYQDDHQWFFGVVVTNGSGSARMNQYAHYTDQMMMEVRKEEQIKAATIGRYGALAMLDYPSSETKDPKNKTIVDELSHLIQIAHPKILYTHNFADKHDTHVGVAVKVIQAIRSLKPEDRPEKVLGCEVWKGLDWMLDDEKMVMDVSGNPKLAQSLIEVFDSQIAGGKRYDHATIGRRLANATYFTSHKVDQSDQLIYAMDLTPLILDDNLDIIGYVTEYIDRFKSDVISKISKMI
jgi:LmbE family N-acetylglucosaminyl deacetylase